MHDKNDSMTWYQLQYKFIIKMYFIIEKKSWAYKTIARPRLNLQTDKYFDTDGPNGVTNKCLVF